MMKLKPGEHSNDFEGLIYPSSGLGRGSEAAFGSSRDSAPLWHVAIVESAACSFLHS